jgi:hypothetical protein
MEACGVLLVWIAVAGQNRRLDIESTPRKELNLCRWCRRRVKRFKRGGKQVAESIIQWFDEIRSAVFLIAVEVEARKLTCADEKTIAKESQLQPNESNRVVCALTSHWICKCPNVSAEIVTELPEAGRMERQTIPFG